MHDLNYIINYYDFNHGYHNIIISDIYDSQAPNFGKVAVASCRYSKYFTYGGCTFCDVFQDFIYKVAMEPKYEYEEE